MSDLPDIYAQRAYKSGKSQVPMLQLICNTSGGADSLIAYVNVITQSFLCTCLKDLIIVRCGKEDT